MCLPDTKALYSLYLDSKINDKKGEYLSEKFGIEGGEKLSTKDALKQILIKKVTEKEDSQEASEERPITERAELADGERPVQERAEEDQPKTKEEVRDDLKDDLKKKLLEGLFK